MEFKEPIDYEENKYQEIEYNNDSEYAALPEINFNYPQES